MAITFTCPHCQHKAEVDDSFIRLGGDFALGGKPITVEAEEEDVLAPRNSDKSNSGNGAAVFVLLLTLGGMSLLIAFVVGLVVMSIPSTQFAQANARQQLCATNLARIGQAMLDYHEDHGSFPPAYVAGPDGKPRHSWRVLLLPYLGEHALYQRYDMSRPWDENSWMVQPMPSVYHCVDDQFADPSSEASYLLVTGPGMIFDGEKSTKLEDITDGPESTILMVEVAGGAQNWLEPKDLDRATLNLAINSGSGSEIGSYHEAGGAHVLMADGTVKWLNNLTSPQIINAMLTKDGNDAVDP
mgnify:CR=1 FL=1